MEKDHKKIINAWAMYDWANSAFATTIMAAVLPVYYASVAAANLPGNSATVYWAYTTSISLLIAAIASPILGALADFSGSKKRLLALFAFIGVLGTALLYFVKTGDWLMASIFFIVGDLGFAGSLVFYDSLLPHIASGEEMDQVSSKGYALGYLGGGLLLAVNLVMIMLAPKELTGLMSRLSFLSVAIWWFVFTIPLLKYVPEPDRHIMAGEEEINPLKASFGRLGRTFKEIRKYRQLFIFLIAFWFYNDGIGTIIKMATIYGAEIGIGQTTLIGTLLMVQFVAIPFAFLFGWLAKKIGTKKSIYLSLLIYTLIAIFGYFMQQEWHFWALGFAVATVQGGSQALSRSLFGRMMPKSKSAEFFGFFSVSEKFAGIAGPFVFGVVGQLVGHSRLSIVSLIIFFIIGAILLSRVNVEEGIAIAEKEEAALQEVTVQA
ncbi:MFS transporter [Leptolinea tardivitalis]|uniref:MFS transporter n=1 Tax=Leptolinea tardivitalis TaxID=229920 RepID=A0A0P6X5U8_9CHLR|nr:MFS transporter [Leptolinea tardivitalis]KPL74741.1 MFS transporter [Leptolinea tardivitalis]GAP22890.1 permeases of the major facilitator superfamily [Leptolinea tardivitalis]